MTALRADGRRGTLLMSAAALAAGVVYLNALDNPFVYDDHRTILDNATLARVGDVRAIVLHEMTRPLVNFSYAVDAAVWGLRPFGFHLTSVLLHVVNVALLFVLVRGMAEDAGARACAGSRVRPMVAATLAAALFGVHPLLTEAVGYVSGRPDVLCGTFFLLACLSARRWMRGGRAPWWGVTLLLWLAALLSKETAIVLPAVLFLYDRQLLDGGDDARRRRLWRLHGPLALLAVVLGLGRIALFVYGERGGGVTIGLASVPEQAAVAWRYLGLLVAPRGQTIFHDAPLATGLSDPRLPVHLLASAGLVAAVALCLRARTGTGLTFGFLWFVLLLLPSGAIVVLDRVEPMAEHRAYLASAGIALAFGVAGAWIWDRAAPTGAMLRGAVPMVFAVAVLSLASRTVLRNAVWADPVALWGEAVERNPGAWMPRTVLGESLHEAGRHEQAVAAFRGALALNPRDEGTYMKLAVCLTELGRKGEAVVVLDALAKVDARALAVPMGLGAVAYMTGDLDPARAHFADVLARDPQNLMALQWLAVLEEQAGRPAEALKRCQQVERLSPGSLSAEDCIRRNRVRPGGAEPPR